MQRRVPDRAVLRMMADPPNGWPRRTYRASAATFWQSGQASALMSHSTPATTPDSSADCSSAACTARLASDRGDPLRPPALGVLEDALHPLPQIGEADPLRHDPLGQLAPEVAQRGIELFAGGLIRGLAEGKGGVPDRVGGVRVGDPPVVGVQAQPLPHLPAAGVPVGR